MKTSKQQKSSDLMEGRRRGALAVMSLQEIADLFGVTLQAVQAVERSALKKLRNSEALRQLAVEFGCLRTD